nr:hypothetical protein [uncultured Flavobacterium sp.]
MQKYDIGDYIDFINTFGYDATKESQRVYKAVLKEFGNMQRLFTSEELELLNIIN